MIWLCLSCQIRNREGNYKHNENDDCDLIPLLNPFNLDEKQSLRVCIVIFFLGGGGGEMEGVGVEVVWMHWEWVF